MAVVLYTGPPENAMNPIFQIHNYILKPKQDAQMNIMNPHAKACYFFEFEDNAFLPDGEFNIMICWRGTAVVTLYDENFKNECIIETGTDKSNIFIRLLKDDDHDVYFYRIDVLDL